MPVQSILVCNENEYRRISIHDILYVRIYDYLSTFHLANKQTISCSKSLNDIMISMPDHFFRINRSYLVNLNEVRSVIPQKRVIILSDSTELMVSYRKIASLKSTLTRYNHTLTR
ncbi:MAG: LytR/AlgR family response regulator transcription factor [Mangrovibacterium sp.]